jgi:hypothetical protein
MQSEISKEQFLKEVHTFRGIISDKRNPISKMDAAFAILFLCAANAPTECGEIFGGLSEDWSRRRDLMVRHGHPLE